MKIDLVREYVEPGQAPAVRAPLSINLGLSRGLMQLAGSLEGAAGNMLRVGKIHQAVDEKKKDMEVTTEALRRSVDFEVGLNDIHRELEKTPPDKNGEVMKNWEREKNFLESKMGTEILDSSSGYKADIYERFKRLILPKIGHAQIRVKGLADAKWLDNERSGLTELSHYVAEKAPLSHDPEGMIGGWSKIAARMRDEGVISAVDFVNLSSGLRATVDRNRKRLEDEMIKQEEREAETRADLALNERFPVDYDAQMKVLGEPEQYTALGLTAEKARNLSNVINGRKEKKNRLVDQAQDQTDAEFTVRLANGDLSRDMVTEAVSQNRLKPAIAKAYIHALDQALEKAMKEEEVQTDHVVYADLREKALRVRSAADRRAFKEEWIRNFGKLGRGDREKLIDLAFKEEEQVIGKDRKRAEDFMKSQILPNEGLFAEKTPEDYRLFYDALGVLDREIDQAARAGKPLTGNAIMQKAREIAPRFQLTIAEQIERERRTRQQLIDSLGKEKKGSAPKAESGGPADESYQLGKIYMDKEGRKAKYLGRNREGKDEWQLLTTGR